MHCPKDMLPQKVIDEIVVSVRRIRSVQNGGHADDNPQDQTFSHLPNPWRFLLAVQRISNDRFIQNRSLKERYWNGSNVPNPEAREISWLLNGRNFPDARQSRHSRLDPIGYGCRSRARRIDHQKSPLQTEAAIYASK
jgi:hypothetical protein